MTQIQNSAPRVAILLGTMNGQRYLTEQLDSFLAQSFTNWHIYASDDGSTDQTLAILESYKEKTDGRLTIYSGPRKGFAANFMSLLYRPEIQADFYAYSDQDDVWEKDKLARAVAWQQSVSANIPALYGSRTMLVDESLVVLGPSHIFQKPFVFTNSLVQNVAPGNTMVFNQTTCDLLRQTSPDIRLAAHDWWTYIVTAGCGGKVFIDPVPGILYRQHGGNLIGANDSFAAKWVRIKALLAGSLHKWSDAHVLALQDLQDKLSPDARRVFNLFKTARNKSFFPRVIGIIQSGVYRQTMLGNIGIAVATLLRKI